MTTKPRPRPATPGALLGVAILLLCSLGTANAFQLGELKTAAAIGQSFDGQVEVYLSPTERNADIRFSITPDITYLSNSELTAFVGSLNAQFETPNLGRPHIRLTSGQPINTAIVSFRLKVVIDGVGFSRNYSFIPRQPLITPTAADGVDRRAPASTTRPPVVSAIELTEGTYGPVRRGDTLWAIAKQVAPSGSKNVAAVVQAIFNANPAAFINGDRNLLKQGVVLQIPGSDPIVVADSIQSTSAATPSVDQPQIENAAEQVSSIEASTPALVELDIGTTLTETTVAAVGTSAGEAQLARKPVSWRTRDPELAAKLDELSNKYAALKARYARQQAVAAGIDSTASFESALVEPIASAEVPVAAEAQPALETPVTNNAAGDALQPKTESRSVAPVASAPAVPEADNENLVVEKDNLADVASANTSGERVVPNVTSGASFSGFLSWIAVALAIALVLVVGALLIKLRSRHQNRAALEQHDELERERKAEVTKKAQQRLTMEGEVERMLKGRNPLGLEEQTIAVNVDDLNLEGEEGDDGADGEQSQIDMSIAHGRYEEAESLLADVIKSSPRNFSAKLRLAEVFYITERIEDFVNIAQDLHQNHRSDITDEDWRRVMRMGKMIAPERPPFSGPQSVSEAKSS